MKRFAILTLIGILVLSTLACTITLNTPEIRTAPTGPTQTLIINEAAPSGTPDLTIGMGAGKLNVSAGGSGLVSGEVRYNVDQLKPTISNQGNQVTIEQKSDQIPATIGKDVINEWNLKLGSTPMELTINAGAYEGTIDLSGVPLTRLQINDGASKATLNFNSLNPQVMESLIYKTGASQVEMRGLANANFKEMTFGGGAGSYTLDFAGTLQQDAKVSITSGVSTMKIIVPNGMRSRIELTGGLNNVDPRGTWTHTGSVYETSGSGPLLSINVEMGVGNLELDHQ